MWVPHPRAVSPPCPLPHASRARASGRTPSDGDTGDRLWGSSPTPTWLPEVIWGGWWHREGDRDTGGAGCCSSDLGQHLGGDQPPLPATCHPDEPLCPAHADADLGQTDRQRGHGAANNSPNSVHPRAAKCHHRRGPPTWFSLRLMCPLSLSPCTARQLRQTLSPGRTRCTKLAGKKPSRSPTFPCGTTTLSPPRWLRRCPPDPPGPPDLPPVLVGVIHQCHPVPGPGGREMWGSVGMSP